MLASFSTKKMCVSAYISTHTTDVYCYSFKAVVVLKQQYIITAVIATVITRLYL